MSFIFDYSNKVALITGVSSGIGLGIARAFARAGTFVIGCSRKKESEPQAQQFIDTVKAEGSDCMYVQVDVTKQTDLERFIEQVKTRFSHIDYVISNAGVNIFKGADICDEETWQYNMDLNLTSHWRLSKLCKPLLEKSEAGVILLMTSNHAYCSIPGCFPYNVTKTAITGLVRSLAIEWGPQIRTVGIAPGFIDTEGNDAWFDSFPDPEAERQRTINLHPVKKIGSVDDVGALCIYLASSFAGFISGTTILMDGGRSALMQDE